MDRRLSGESLESFAARLASKDAVPGGGGAAALCGALGAALGAMAARLSLSGREVAIEPLIARADALRERLLALIDEDAAGFAPLAAAYAIPRDAPGRAETLCAATLTALSAPMEMLRQTAAAVSMLEELLPNCKKLLLSDVGCAAALAEGALRAAAMNVWVNTRTLPKDRREPIEREADGLVKKYTARAAAVYAAVEARLREEK